MFLMPCVICGDTGDIEIDHILSVKMGGDSSLENLQPLCRVCNAIKRDRKTNSDVMDWIQNNAEKYQLKKDRRSMNRLIWRTGV